MKDYTTYDNILGIFFFWAVITHQNKHKEFDKGIPLHHLEYLDEKSIRYLNQPININFPSVYSKLKGLNDDIKSVDINNIIEATDKIWGLENINFDFTMFGVDENTWLETKESIYNAFLNTETNDGFIGIIGSTYGVSITLADKLGNVIENNFKHIVRNYKLKELDI